MKNGEQLQNYNYEKQEKKIKRVEICKLERKEKNVERYDEIKKDCKKVKEVGY